MTRALLVALTLGLAGCGSTVEFEQQALPAPPGPAGAAVIGDVVRCGDWWYAVGGLYLDEPTSDQDTTPAAWRSSDGTTWEALNSEADTYWGSRAVLYTAACADGTFAAMGSRAGGGHGFPRFSNFGVDDSGDLVDEQPHLSVFGGLSWAGVGQLAGGDGDWLVVGNRQSGPAVWVSEDGFDFQRLEGVPSLADDAGWKALASGAVWTGQEWVVVGGGTQGGSTDRQPLAWTSPEGRFWTRVPLPGVEGFEDVQRVVRVPNGSPADLLAVGLAGEGFGAWRRDSDGWGRVERFGGLAEEPTGAPYVASLVASAAGYVCTVSDGAHFELWRSEDGSSWEKLEAPVSPAPGGDRTLGVATDGRRLLLGATDDSGSLWIGD